MTHRARKLLAALAALGALTACAPASDSAAPDFSRELERLDRAVAQAKELQEGYDEFVEDLETPGAGEDTAATSYDRDEFGSAWADVDQNGCSTRDDILARDLTDLVVDGDECTVLFGTLADPYTGEVYEFERGHSVVDIDHIVALSAAWQLGADSWTDSQREAFANDPENLNASYMGANRSKGDKTLSEWMPTNGEFHCEYATQFVTVIEKYELTLTPADAAVAREAC